MEWVVLVTVLALAQYFRFGMRAGAARGRHDIAAPAMTGHVDFERHLRVQLNTLEQLAIFLPALWMFAHWVHAPAAAAIGLVFVLGRHLYGQAYVTDPSRRGPGFGLTVLSNGVLLLGAAIGALIRLV